MAPRLHRASSLRFFSFRFAFARQGQGFIPFAPYIFVPTSPGYDQRFIPFGPCENVLYIVSVRFYRWSLRYSACVFIILDLNSLGGTYTAPDVIIHVCRWQCVLSGTYIVLQYVHSPFIRSDFILHRQCHCTRVPTEPVCPHSIRRIFVVIYT